MANLQQLLSLPPLTPNEIGQDQYQFPPDAPDIIQLATDCINVVEGRVPMSSFTPAYQLKIRSFYRFSATRYATKIGKTAHRTRSTLEII